MPVCPRCGSACETLHSIPAQVITKEILKQMGHEEGPADVEACEACITDLMGPI